LFRDMISEGGVVASIGTRSGTALDYHLRFPLICAAIRPLRDAASLSRFIIFEPLKDDTRADPVNILLQQFGAEKIAATRHALALGLLRHMGTLRKLQFEIEQEYAKMRQLPAHTTSRFQEALHPILAMLKFVKEDYHTFAERFCDSRRTQLERLRITSENEQLFENILSSPFQIKNGDNDRVSWVTSIRILLADLNHLHVINQTKQGVYFDAKNEWLVVHWIEATQGVLSGTRYKQEAASFLKQIAERSPYHVSTDMARTDKVLERLMLEMGPGHSLDLISVFSVGHLLDAARRRADEERNRGPNAPGGHSRASEGRGDHTDRAETLGSGGDDIVA